MSSAARGRRRPRRPAPATATTAGPTASPETPSTTGSPQSPLKPKPLTQTRNPNFAAGVNGGRRSSSEVKEEASGTNLFTDRKVNNAAVGGAEYVEDPADASITSGEKFSGMDARQRIEWMVKSSRETYDTAKQGLQTNYYGAKHVIEALLPLLQASSDGRIVNVSSDGGLLRFFSNEELKQELNDVENLTEERLDEVLDTFLKDFEAGAAEARGWPTGIGAYMVAKAALNAYSRVLARRHPELRVNCAHPGFVRTDITRNSGVLTPEEGASNVTKVALLPAGGPTGAYFALGQEASFV